MEAQYIESGMDDIYCKLLQQLLIGKYDNTIPEDDVYLYGNKY